MWIKSSVLACLLLPSAALIKGNLNQSRNTFFSWLGHSSDLETLTKTSQCDNNIKSCSATSGSNTCCSPKMGVVVLALQWLTSTGPKDAWTLHGLWPDNCDGTQGPRNGCDRTRNYNDMKEIISKDTKLWDQMNTYFSSFKGDNPSFWTHEWTKHGTCVSTLHPDCYDNYEPKQEVRDFFNKTLELRQRFDLFPVLQEGGLKPGRLYSRNQWLEALQPVFGKSVVLRCRGNMIQEVHIFLQVYGKDRYELTGALSHSNCPTRINYPAKNH